MAAEIIIAHGIWRLSQTLASLIPVNISVIGPTGSGKTTLDRQLTTRGEVRMFSEDERTHHTKTWLGNYRMPEATKKRVKSEGLARTVVSRDLGGHEEYRTLWLADMINRDSKNVFVIIDHRHILDSNNVDTPNSSYKSFRMKVNSGTINKSYRAQPLLFAVSEDGKWSTFYYCPYPEGCIDDTSMQRQAELSCEKGSRGSTCFTFAIWIFKLTGSIIRF